MPAIEQFLTDLITAVLPHAATGVLLAACVIAVSRLPLLNIGALAAAGVCLGAILSTGPGQIEAGMQMATAGLVSAGILLLSGGQLWQRPSLRIGKSLPPELGGQGGDDRAIASTWLFRLAAAAVIALAAHALAPALLPDQPVSDMRLALWLAGMGLLAGFSGGSAIVSATGFVTALSALALVTPLLAPDITQQPLAYALPPTLMILTALAFSFAAVLRRGE